MDESTGLTSRKVARALLIMDKKYILVKALEPPPPHCERVGLSSADSSTGESKESKVMVELKDESKFVMLRDPAVALALKSAKRSTKVSLPPILQTTVRTNHTFRFRVNSTCNLTPIGLGGVIGAMGVVGKTATSVVAIHTAARLKSIKVWLPALSSANTFFIDWVGTVIAGITPDMSQETSVPDGVTITGCITCKPPKGSLAREWLNAGTLSSLAQALFTINSPVGAIIDLHVEGCISNTVATQTITVATAAVGTFYYLALDGPSSNKVIPQGLLTTS